jgi:hypothetical protein
MHTNTNTPVPNIGKEVHQPDPQALLFDPTNIHRLIPMTEELMEFPCVLSMKGNFG